MPSRSHSTSWRTVENALQVWREIIFILEFCTKAKSPNKWRDGQPSGRRSSSIFSRLFSREAPDGAAGKHKQKPQDRPRLRKQGLCWEGRAADPFDRPDGRPPEAGVWAGRFWADPATL